MITWTVASPRRQPCCLEAWKSSDQNFSVSQPTHKDSNHHSDLNSTTLYLVNLKKNGIRLQFSSCNQKQDKLISTIISVSHGFAVQGHNRMLIVSIFFFANHNSKSLSFDHPNNTETNLYYAAQLASVEPLGHIDIFYFKQLQGVIFFFRFSLLNADTSSVCVSVYKSLIQAHIFLVMV